MDFYTFSNQYGNIETRGFDSIKQFSAANPQVVNFYADGIQYIKCEDCKKIISFIEWKKTGCVKHSGAYWCQECKPGFKQPTTTSAAMHCRTNPDRRSNPIVKIPDRRFGADDRRDR